MNAIQSIVNSSLLTWLKVVSIFLMLNFTSFKHLHVLINCSFLLCIKLSISVILKKLLSFGGEKTMELENRGLCIIKQGQVLI